MSTKLFISNFLVYETPGEEAKGAYSAGLAIASRLNGNRELVGSFNKSEDDEVKRRKVGFITFREKFDSEEAAKDFKEANKSKYQVGSALNPREWAWGEVDEESTLELGSQGADVHYINFIGHDDQVPVKEEIRFEGKVTEQVEA
ncbi:hypothetical protein SLH46_06270 [Draconibacterium sp. IB214405]|uniref:hypothetical protein n=1 Tax=Draconibacterium sp. IB214405 TaxID=3097352 RepID=UPI002A13C1C8|nr:hypothetical protein [Draconibacterium sp. IB214405]MDX8338777.1 hypothetical protein [Draconibacterium sp. IB214405]